MDDLRTNARYAMTHVPGIAQHCSSPSGPTCAGHQPGSPAPSGVLRGADGCPSLRTHDARRSVPYSSDGTWDCTQRGSWTWSGNASSARSASRELAWTPARLPLSTTSERPLASPRTTLYGPLDRCVPDGLDWRNLLCVAWRGEGWRPRALGGSQPPRSSLDRVADLQKRAVSARACSKRWATGLKKSAAWSGRKQGCA